MQDLESNSHLGPLVRFSLTIVFAVTVLLIGGLIADKQSTTLAVVSGTLFFTLFGGFVILVLSGQLTRIHETHEKEQTVRQRDRMSFSLVTAPQLPVQPEVREVMAETPALPTNTFVPAVPEGREGVKIAAYDFIYALFENGTEGKPDPKRVLPKESKAPGKIQYSKPKPEVLEYLMGLDMVRMDEGKMIFYNEPDFPTLVEAKRTIKHGRKV